jgi:hypothetical protein
VQTFNCAFLSATSHVKITSSSKHSFFGQKNKKKTLPYFRNLAVFLRHAAKPMRNILPLSRWVPVSSERNEA